jgi:cytochrome c553
MKSKLKVCDGCQKETVIWKSSGTGGLKLCKYCWSCHKSGDDIQKPTNSNIPRVSAKRAKKDAEYSKLRQRYLTENPLCMVNVNGCMHNATDIHHTFAGSNRDAFYLVQSTWLGVCRSCHDWIHNHPEEARIMNWLK